MFIELQPLFQLTVTIALCGLIGLERETKKKGAGLQTYSLVGLSACAFTMLAMSLYATDGFAPIDLSRVIQAITTGIGFIGAGLIFKGDKGGIEGLTTAAGLLVVSAIGVAVGLENYFLAISVTAFMLFVFIIFGMLEIKFFHK
ncbi:MAG: MgtC/SapB family protein [Minisyncoccales bacterium]